MNGLTVWVVYRNPRDYPGWYVVRGQDAQSDGTVHPHNAPLIITDSLARIQDEMERRGLTCLTRHPDDDPTIVETWI